MKKIFLFLLIFIFILSINLSFADNSTDVLTNTLSDDEVLDDSMGQTNIYVSNDGSDSLGDGSVDNPYQTLNYTIETASNNTNIYLKGGTYNSTGYEIVNKSISIVGLGEVVVDGKNGEISQSIFKVRNGSSLVLNNIKFVNGYCDLDGETPSCIINQGQLFITNSTFDNFKTSVGVITNENYLCVDNVTTSNLANSELFSAPYKHNIPIQFIYNVGYCDIYNSHIGSSYNNKNMTLNNSYIERFVSNKDYTNQNSYAYFNNSFVYLLTIVDCDKLIFKNTIINCDFTLHEYTHSIEYSNMFFDNCTFTKNYKYKEYNSHYYLNFDYCNLSVISSNILVPLIFVSSNATISYSCILETIFAKIISKLNVNYNWWGNNKGPHISKSEYSSLIANYWIVMMVENVNDTQFSIDLTKYTNGLDVWDLDSPSKIYRRLAKFETETGHFTKSSDYLVNGKFTTNLTDNNLNTMVYATVDNQVLRMVVGNGNVNCSIYVSNTDGNDYFYDGSYENPYKTLKKAVSSAFSGNTIYVLPGVYTLSWNSNLKISKNLTFIGIGNAVLSRPNARSIFIVDQKGILNIENLNFTTATLDAYSDTLIHLNGGNVNIKNSNFYEIKTKGAIYSDDSEYINIDNVTFTNVLGCAIAGVSDIVNVNNSKFINGSSYYYQYHQYDYLYEISVKSDLIVANSLFEGNEDGLIKCIGNQQEKKKKAYIYNSSFLNNGISRTNTMSGISASSNEFNKAYSVVEGCIFNNNFGNLVFADIINNCSFVNNSREIPTDHFIQNINPDSLVNSKLINNSYFYNNSYISKSYEAMVVHGDEIYYSTFIENTAAYGGAVSNAKEVHYCIFVNNTAIYGGDDIFVYNGDINCSSNWWGSNQKPDQKRVFVFIGTLILDNWVIMTMNFKNNVITASLSNLLDNNEVIRNFDKILPSRNVTFSTVGGKLNPENTYLINNHASTKLSKNTSADFDVFGRIDNQITSLTVFNNSTLIIMDDLRIYGKDVLFNISLINVNGHKISNQDINVIISHKGSVIDSFILTTNSKGETSFNVDYSIGEYDVKAYYLGNGYFEKSNSSASIIISSIKTKLLSHNYTYFGKNNKFYSILTDGYGKYLLNQSLVLKIYNLNDKLINIVEVKTGSGGRADVLLSLDIGSYKMKWYYVGNEWYEKTECESFVTIKPIGTCITLLNTTIYGKGNDYEFTFKDVYGNLISDETISLKISNGSQSKEFNLVTNKGMASITINLLPGKYNLQATYKGDDVYGPSNASATLIVHPVFVTCNHNSYQIIPKNGVFTVILKDMYGTKVSGENVSLELVNKNLQKKYDTITDANGEANFKIDAPEGIYFSFINYNGNIWYDESASAATIEISPNAILNPVYISGNNLIQYYGENKYYLIDFNDTNAYSLEGKTINVVITSKSWSKAFNLESNVFGQARIQITLEPGIYNITYNYRNEYYGLFAENSSEIIVYKMPTSLIASNLIMNHGEARNFEVKLVNKNGNPISNLPVTISVDGKEYNITTNHKGVAKLLLNLDLGSHNIAYSFNNDNYISSKGNCTVLVVDGSKTATNLAGEDFTARENEIINYTISLSNLLNIPISSSEVILNIVDEEGNLINTSKSYTDLNGSSTFTFKLEHGNYFLNVLYNGNEFYLGSFNTNKLNVKPLEEFTETILFGEDLKIVNGENNYYYVVLTTVDGEFIKNQKIEFIVKNNSFNSFTDENGRAYLKAPFSPGSYEVIARFNGLDNLTKASVRNYISVYGAVVNFYSIDVVKSYNNGTHYYVALYDTNNEPLVNKTIKFFINNKIYQNITDENGFACFEVWLNPGKYVINATYQGQYPDEYASVSNNITVLTTILSENLNEYYTGYTIFSATFLDFNDNLLSNTKINFLLDNVQYTINTDKFGAVTINSNLKPGKHYINLINTITGQEEKYVINIKSTLTTKDLVKYYKSSSKFEAIFKDGFGNPLKNTNIKFSIGKKVYVVKTNHKGVAKLSINLKPGTYTISTLNTKTSEKNTNKITVKTIIISKNKKIKKGKKTNFKVKILNSKGKIAKKVVVKFKVKGKIYKIKTNSKGIAKLNIKLKKGKYTVYTTFRGLSVKNLIIVK